MSKHTPGPWKVITDATAREVEVFEIADISHFRIICDGRGDGFSSAGDAYADARLIAAAPELLEALKACWDLGIDSSVVPMVRAAIAKAAGSAS